MTTIMAREARETPEVVRNQLQTNKALISQLVQELKQRAPSFLYIIGRGSSDHAGVFAKYLFEVELGIPVCNAALSISGVFNTDLQLSSAAVFVISQSGRSPDLLKQTQSAQKSGAFVVAFVNDESSPLAHLADAVVPLCAGKERAVAATKSFIATLTSLLHVCAEWNNDPKLLESLQKLPECLNHECSQQQQLDTPFFQSTQNVIILGRGFGYAISREIALKLKEILSIQAEAFSSAEFLHGPVTLAENHLKIINVHIDDESSEFHKAIIDDVEKRGAIFSTLHCDFPSMHARIIPLVVTLRFYLDVEAIAKTIGLDPDSPPGLRKVTKTT